MKGGISFTLVLTVSLATLVQFSFSIRSLSKPSSVSINHTGFSLPLLHKDHPKIQQYLDGLGLKPQSLSPTSRKYNDKVYFVSFLTGSKYVERTAIFDTGSSFTWVNASTPFDDPSQSSSYKPLPCDETCGKVPNYSESCHIEYSECLYRLAYVDGTISSGHVGIDNFFFFNSTIMERDEKNLEPVEVIFGTQLEEESENSYPGIMGVGGGPLGMLGFLRVSQISMCFPPIINNPGFVRFGDDAYFGTYASSVVPYTDDGAHYRINVNAITVQGLRIQPESVNASNLFIFDTGAGMTYLQPALLDAVLEKVEDSIDVNPDLGIIGYGLCYDPYYLPRYKNISLTFEIDGGLPLNLQFHNIWFPSGNSFCLAFGKSPSDKNIFGMRQMQGTNFAFQLHERKLHYDHLSC